MKRLIGGEYLLDISSIELAKSVDGTTKTNITDASIIEQLTNLQNYIANPNMAKPIWIKLYNGETDELVIARGTFANVDTGEFEICVHLNGYKLVIYIEFTQVLNGDNVPMEEWYIDTNDAKYLFTTDAQNVKATIEDEDFANVTFAGITKFENIKDADGHNRFIGGNITTNPITGVTYTYGKWALSGTHLLIVLCATLEDEAIISFSQMGSFELPSWVANKLVPLYTDVISSKKENAFAQDGSGQEMQIYTTKTDNVIKIITGGLTLTDDRNIRIAIDFLIDND